MKYMLLMYADESLAANFTPAEQQAVQKEWFVFMHEAKAAGVLLENGGLSPAGDTTTVRVRDGKTLMTDGPFAETHEQMGGYSVLDCKDLDEAVRWAARVPTARFGSIEVRPLWSPN